MNKKDLTRIFYMLNGKFAKKGYDWWWHNFTGVNEKTGEERSFFIEFFTCNPKCANQDKSNGKNPILGQSKEAKEHGYKPSYLMIKAGWWGKNAKQLHRFIGWDSVKIENNKQTGFSVSADDCFCSENILKGSINVTDAKNHPEFMCDDGQISWDLQIKKDVAFHVGYGAGKLFRDLKAFEMYWHAQGMKSLFSGTVTADGEKFTIKEETSFGYCDKNWGANFTSPWVWLSSWDLTSKKTGKKLENSVFDIGGGRPKVFGVALNRKLLSDFWYEGKSYEFNFSKFWTCTKTKFEGKETDKQIVWYVRQETTKAVMETNIVCDKEKMLLVNYESPDGAKRHNRLWNGGTGYGTVKLFIKKKGKLELLDEIEVKHVGCEYGEYC